MVKTNRFPRGHSSGFGYRQVDNLSDSEGFGSSGRVDTEMAASEGSCAPKRKSISLSAEKCEYLGVPWQVISVTNMRRWEKKNLKLKLRVELDQIRILRKKIAARLTNAVALSSSSVIHSSSDVQKVVPVQSFQKPPEKISGKGKKSDVLPGKGKKRVPPVQSDPSCVKRGDTGRFESVKQVVASSTSHVMLMNQCESLLQRLTSHNYGTVFNQPVDVVKFKIPDYFTIIKHPMDLGTVKKKLTSGVYSGPLDFLADVRLTFSNAMTYNPPGNNVHAMAATLSKYFELRWKSIEKKISQPDAKSVPPMKPGVSKEVEALTPKEMPPLKKRKVSSLEQKAKPNIVKRIMTIEEKHKLSRDLESVVPELPTHIVEFLRERSFNANQTGEDEIEVDINDFSEDSLLTLRKLVDDHLQKKQENQGKAKSCEMETLNDSRLGNSSMQPCRGNNHVDEDVDIGENDPPVLSYPPVEIEKDAAHRNSKCSSSSSSSSDSGSSSSDSDSGNSSGSAKTSSPAPRIKETLSSGEVLVPKTSGPVDPYDANQAVSCLDQLEQTSQPRPVSVEAESRQEEESAPSKRQVSPGKLYRAALMRGRFADTILKARAKTLDPGKKGDPEKLRQDREELERQQREEKARLQAEAKAAEDARKQAEAEAAAEAKRKRQLEREAARQALLKMEKTVEINENCPLLEDLEMLRVAPPEHIPSSVDESSPAHSEDGLGAFRLRGSTNPLEQLGLYMKVDEEEEEEGEPDDVLDPGNDIEEGEID